MVIDCQAISKCYQCTKLHFQLDSLEYLEVVSGNVAVEVLLVGLKSLFIIGQLQKAVSSMGLCNSEMVTLE